MPKIPFTKPALSLPAQTALLMHRGMAVPDPAEAQHYLRYIGYYRLSGYWFPFQHRDGSGQHDHFRPGAAFGDILNLYIFDRKLRLVVMDALERLEVAARTAISDVMSAAHGPHWFMSARHFEPGYNHARFLTQLRTNLGDANPNTQAQFIQHYYATYGTPALPPSWMVFELLSFGTVSILYKNLQKPDRQAIASQFQLPPDKLVSWLHALTHLRNVCAHHGRVWNRTFGISPTVPKSERGRVPAPRKFYAHALVMQVLLQTVSPKIDMSARVTAVICGKIAIATAGPAPCDPSGALRALPGASALVWVGCRPQAVLVVDIGHLAGDGQAHEGTLDLVLGVAVGQGRDDGPPVTRDAVAQQLEDRGRRARDHGVGVVGGKIAAHAWT